MNNQQQAAKGVLFSILLRILSFFLTQLTIRLVNPQTLGQASVRLELICSTTVLFLGREGLRLALLRRSAVEEDSEAKSSVISGTGTPGSSNSTSTGTETDSSSAKGSTETEIHEEGEEEELKEKNEQIRVHNVAWLSIPIGFLLTTIALLFHLHTYSSQFTSSSSSSSTSNAAIWDYQLGGIYFCIATIFEYISEPFCIYCLRTLDVQTRSKAEGMGSIIKALTCVVLLSLVTTHEENIDNDNTNNNTGEDDWGLTLLPGPISAFGLAQCAYAIIFSIVMIREKKSSVPFPTYISSTSSSKSQPSSQLPSSSSINILQNNLDKPTLKLTTLFSIQSIAKHLLTEGDRIILTTLAGSYDSGVYAMASSYGSMASRIIFQPLEENGRLLFSNYHAKIANTSNIQSDISSSDTNTKSSSSSPSSISATSTTSSTNVQKSTIQSELLQTYTTLQKIVLYIGLTIATLGSNYTSLLLQLIAGPTWGTNQEAISTLSAFCFYTMLCAWNGISEAFVYGVADHQSDVHTLIQFHGFVGGVFYVLAPWLVMGKGVGGSDSDSDADSNGGSGTVGLVMANGLCMILRSLYSIYFASRYFEEELSKSSTSITDTNITRSSPSSTTSTTKNDTDTPITSSNEHPEKRQQTTKSMYSRFQNRIRSMNQLLWKILPRPPVLFTFLLAYIMTRYSNQKYFTMESSTLSIAIDGSGHNRGAKTLLKLVLSKNTLVHVGIGISNVIMIGLAAYQSECEFGYSLLAMVGKKKNKYKEDEAVTKEMMDKTKID